MWVGLSLVCVGGGGGGWGGGWRFKNVTHEWRQPVGGVDRKPLP